MLSCISPIKIRAKIQTEEKNGANHNMLRTITAKRIMRFFISCSPLTNSTMENTLERILRWVRHG